MAIKVTVDHNRCVGSQLCVRFSPGVFILNQEGQSVVADVSQDEESNIVSTAEQCPQCAIRVETDSGEVLFPPPELL